MITTLAPSNWNARIADCVASTRYYDAVNPDAMGGRWFITIDDDERVVACVWAMLDAPSAYIDFLSVRPEHRGYCASKLVEYAITYLHSQGARNIRAVIRESNLAAIRVAAAFGSKIEPGYALVYWNEV
jgi:ribosomal protein S18 acetylase RimI-like enzyme